MRRTVRRRRRRGKYGGCRLYLEAQAAERLRPDGGESVTLP